LILADTMVWIDYFRNRTAEMHRQLEEAKIVMHPFIVAELALGSLQERGKTLIYLDMLPKVKVANLEEVRRMIERHNLYSKGIGLTDAHLVASAMITPSVRLWTRDKRLRSIAADLGVAANLDE
jgi:predicted nucleic acid-binding protein